MALNWKKRLKVIVGILPVNLQNGLKRIYQRLRTRKGESSKTRRRVEPYVNISFQKLCNIIKVPIPPCLNRTHKIGTVYSHFQLVAENDILFVTFPGEEIQQCDEALKRGAYAVFIQKQFKEHFAENHKVISTGTCFIICRNSDVLGTLCLSVRAAVFSSSKLLIRFRLHFTLPSALDFITRN
jgi:hypothetical protein